MPTDLADRTDERNQETMIRLPQTWLLPFKAKRGEQKAARLSDIDSIDLVPDTMRTGRPTLRSNLCIQPSVALCVLCGGLELFQPDHRPRPSWPCHIVDP